MKKLKSRLQNLGSAGVSYAPSNPFRMPWAQKSNSENQMATMGTVGTIFSIVNRTSTAVSQVEWRLYKKAASGRDEDRKEVTNHRAIDLWQNPNDEYSRQMFVEAVQQHMDLTGEGWMFVAYDDRNRAVGPLELWPVRPDKMTPVPSDTGSTVSGYVFKNPDGKPVPLDREEIIMMKIPHPLDPYRGMGPVQTLINEIEGIRLSAQWNRNFFLNGATPGGIIEAPETLGETQFKRLQEQWSEEHKGVHNAHRPAIIEGGAKWVDVKYTMKDMQFTELRNMGRDLIHEAFGISKAMLGTVTDVNRANNEAQMEMFARHLTVPRLDRWKGALNHNKHGLLALVGKDEPRKYEFDYDNPVPEDQERENAELKARTEAYKTLIDSGVEPESAANVVGLPPMRHVITVTTPPVPDPNVVPNGKPAARIEIVNYG